jgi:hypothetical protein
MDLQFEIRRGGRSSGKNPLLRSTGRLTRIRFSEEDRNCQVQISPPLAGDTGRRKAVFVFLGLRFSEITRESKSRLTVMDRPVRESRQIGARPETPDESANSLDGYTP